MGIVCLSSGRSNADCDKLAEAYGMSVRPMSVQTINRIESFSQEPTEDPDAARVMAIRRQVGARRFRLDLTKAGYVRLAYEFEGVMCRIIGEDLEDAMAAYTTLIEHIARDGVFCGKEEEDG